MLLNSGPAVHLTPIHLSPSVHDSLVEADHLLLHPQAEILPEVLYQLLSIEHKGFYSNISQSQFHFHQVKVSSRLGHGQFLAFGSLWPCRSTRFGPYSVRRTPQSACHRVASWQCLHSVT